MEATLTLRPIGYIASPRRLKFDAPHQPSGGGADRCVLELLPGQGYETAVRDLAGFSRVWLIWWFHRNQAWRPMVLPPRGPARRRGVFATRSPHRPNPLGLTPVKLVAVRGLRLTLEDCDLLQGTPVFDIKPYLPAYDCFPDAAAGWLAEVDAAHQTPPPFAVRWEARAMEQAEWLQREWGVDFRPRMVELLGRDPAPHRTRRIRRRGTRRWEIGCGAWRGIFTLEGTVVTLHWLEGAFPRSFLEDRRRTRVPDREAQLAFLERWPDQSEGYD